MHTHTLTHSRVDMDRMYSRCYAMSKRMNQLSIFWSMTVAHEKTNKFVRSSFQGMSAQLHCYVDGNGGGDGDGIVMRVHVCIWAFESELVPILMSNVKNVEIHSVEVRGDPGDFQSEVRCIGNEDDDGERWQQLYQ